MFPKYQYTMIVIILKKWSVELFLYKHEIEQLNSLEIELRTRWDLSTSHPPSLLSLYREAGNAVREQF